ncbi:MAG: helix-turn-helix domain-containing protein [Pseudobdellovibrionaceae bacterium]
MDYDITHKDGKPYVLIPLHEYRSRFAKGGAAVAAEKPAPQAAETPAPSVTAKAAKSVKVPKGENPVRFFRGKTGLTQVVLAKKAGISRTYLTEIETGAKNGSIQAMKNIADALGVSIDDLV